jgi:hypothetical protein
VLIFWDAIFSFANKQNLNFFQDSCEIYEDRNFFQLMRDPLIFLDLLCVAMIAYVKHSRKITVFSFSNLIVMESDQSGCFQRLLKFPPIENPHFLVEMAMNIKGKFKFSII